MADLFTEPLRTSDVSPADLIAKLDALHATRAQMSHASIYHGTYVEEAIRLNERLRKLTGKDYGKHKFEAWDKSRRTAPEANRG